MLAAYSPSISKNLETKWHGAKYKNGKAIFEGLARTGAERLEVGGIRGTRYQKVCFSFGESDAPSVANYGI